MEERQLTFKYVYNQKTASQENKEIFLCNIATFIKFRSFYACEEEFLLFPCFLKILYNKIN